ncbi:uncharacterized protein LOC9654449 [Selaginella moellendorffii]|uniref:uncharacterized protein LOC9654449 n=1 Tax=Selaginella moellendorffii TaxID=88036 RepID=UPI000D1C62FC|nr:uncharacterized protein LOC9654449 [Selaginella moellendorffii]|eukprot:XP_002983307.2 uncharacterized protein LOC9654449 [Selaginella moellendorffii]
MAAASVAATKGSFLGRSIKQQQWEVNHSPHKKVSIFLLAQDRKDETPPGEGSEQKQEKTSLLTSITDALDFSQARSERDADLIDEARQATKSGEKMSREQYAALRRKIGGTYKDFFKESIDVKGAYVETGWVDKRCKVCGKDTSKEPRSKDKLGR